METKEQLVGHIRRWIEVDNRIADLQRQIKECREEKKNMSGALVEVMKSNETVTNTHLTQPTIQLV